MTDPLPAGESPSRAALLDALSELLTGHRDGGVLRVAIDGPDAAGKTTLADELADRVGLRGRPVIRASVDGFHQPAATRRRRGSLSAEGYFHDAFDYDALRTRLLDPLRPGGDRRYQPASFDYRADTALDVPTERAPDNAVLLVDGVFLLRPELRAHWDLAIYLHISPAESLRRALDRDVEVFGSAGTVQERYKARYLPGQALYRDTATPHDQAHILIDNEDPWAPRVLHWRSV
ncbi:uridine kinase [Frankia sp. CNm7]|uniref:Uridine kinase n=1 Tax=Frankia nepalensis TaxID=1836974 RepID=A0A937RDC1_9ACTN|nr:uridine kinase [Frankia nepalensis]MBL7497990.1 uridine kinase [Frankia nepalensis]MBL7509072.1 uridine kinase [Frankia nepalensis]MBL7516825.1 uridine kinase [Frankia nepalensis]MBL7627822.1 uridine kinase [Frankia nepalensis]